MLPLPHWRRELDGQLARTNTPHRLWRLRLVAACAAEELHGPRGEHAPRASPSRAGVVGGVRPRAKFGAVRRFLAKKSTLGSPENPKRRTRPAVF